MTMTNGLWKDRYVEVTQQARRLPIAVSLIVDQDHVDRVLTVFNNSPLRFLTTQVLLNHYPGSVRPLDPSSPGFGGPGPGLGGLGFGGPGPGGLGFGGPGSGRPEAAQDLEANMELVIYGIVTLYERYPPRPTPGTR
jgi:hypothetical protein